MYYALAHKNCNSSVATRETNFKRSLDASCNRL